MRFLLTTVPGAGHLFPLVPLAWSLRSLGHEILLATAGAGTVFGPGAGLTTVDVAPGLEVEAIASTLHDSGQSEHGDLPRERAIALFTAVSHEIGVGLASAPPIDRRTLTPPKPRPIQDF